MLKGARSTAPGGSRIKTFFQLRRDDVAFHGRVRVRHALRQAQDEIAAVYLPGQVDQVFDEDVGHGAIA